MRGPVDLVPGNIPEVEVWTLPWSCLGLVRPGQDPDLNILPR